MNWVSVCNDSDSFASVNGTVLVGTIGKILYFEASPSFMGSLICTSNGSHSTELKLTITDIPKRLSI